MVRESIASIFEHLEASTRKEEATSEILNGLHSRLGEKADFFWAQDAIARLSEASGGSRGVDSQSDINEIKRDIASLNKTVEGYSAGDIAEIKTLLEIINESLVAKADLKW